MGRDRLHRDYKQTAGPLAAEFSISHLDIVTMYAPMIYTAPCVRFLMRADSLRGKGGELALEIESFVGPCEIAPADRRVLFGAHKTRSQ
jgi:hypothetical protein